MFLQNIICLHYYTVSQPTIWTLTTKKAWKLTQCGLVFWFFCILLKVQPINIVSELSYCSIAPYYREARGSIVGWGTMLQAVRLQVQYWMRSFWDFLRSSGSGTGSTQPREDNWGATWMTK
jgi:hypothetical protein